MYFFPFFAIGDAMQLGAELWPVYESVTSVSSFEGNKPPNSLLASRPNDPVLNERNPGYAYSSLVVG